MVPSLAPPEGDPKVWCRGQVGVRHKPRCVTYRASKQFKEPKDAALSVSSKWRTLICSVCSRHLAYFWPFNDTDKPPAWVDK